MSVKRIGVLTSGGDAPGMNPCVRAVVRTALYRGLECYGIRRGWNGLITGDIVRLDEKSVSHTINRGGTILYTARSQEFMTEEGQRRAVSTCKFLGLDSIIAIGGDGTFRGAQALSKYGINVIGIPGTIDNDISCTNYCIGFDTAANTAIECIDKLRDTMQSHERCSVVEVMGRNAGYLAMYVGLAVGATAVLVPEEPIDFERDVIEKIRQARFNGFTHYMIVVAEGAGSAADIAAKIKDAIDANKAEHQSNSTDKFAKFMFSVPGLPKFVVWLAYHLDKHGLLPRKIIELSPFHTSMFITNLASIKTSYIHHHCYEFGTTSVFVCMGKPVPNYMSGDLTKKMMPIGVVMDERICTGYEYAAFCNDFRRYMRLPRMLEYPFCQEEPAKEPSPEIAAV